MKLLLYCTKAKPYLYGMYSGFETRYGYHLTNDKNVFNAHSVLNGKIVAECDFEVEEISSEKLDNGVGYEPIFYTETIDDISKKSCLTQFEIENYLGCKAGGEVVGYAIHIKNLHIFDEPMELEYCFTEKSYKIIDKIFTDEIMTDGKWYRPVNKAPQNMMRVKRVLKEDGILISIRPEWLVRILNHEKTIEVRKKVLKEMLK